MSRPVLLFVPGLGGSCGLHWQTRWEGRCAGACRVHQTDWDRPDRDAWVAALDAAVGPVPEPPVLIAHSLGCILVAHWAHQPRQAPVAGALLVSPADVDDERRAPPEAAGFAPIPRARLPFPARVVLSRSDPYVEFDRGAELARAWGAALDDVGDLGHINVESGHGEWPEGERYLAALLADVAGSGGRVAAGSA